MTTIPLSEPLNASNPTNEPTTQSQTQTLVLDVASPASNAPILHEKSPSQQPTAAGNTPNRGVPVETIDIASKMSPHRVNLSKIAQLEPKFDDRYDSNNEIGPFYDAVDREGDQDWMEDAMSESRPFSNEGETGGNHDLDPQAELQEPMPSLPVHIPIEDEVFEKFKKPELVHELKIRGILNTGNKSELKVRLKEALSKKVVVSGELQKKKKKKKKTQAKSGIGRGFIETAYWRILDADVTIVEEPENPTFKIPRAPTINEQDGEFVPVKHNFSKHKFDIPVFKAMTHAPQRFANGRAKFNRDGTFMRETTIRNMGNIKPEFVKMHKLTPESRPDEFASIFLPFAKNVPKGQKKEMISFELLTKWTNLKATLANAGQEKGLYPEFRPFTVREVRQHLGLYVFQGVAPCPQIQKRFKPQRVDKVHGNDFIYSSFGPNAERRHRHFKAFFASQDPAIDPPARMLFPNWKVRPMLTWLNFICSSLWLLGLAFSVDEMTMRFKGKHADKRRITYKNEGDGFQADALCQDGYTYQVYMRNDPAPSKYLNQGLSPLHSRVMALFDSVDDEYHQCAMDNLYNSAAFCRAAYHHDKKVLCHGVARKGGRGIPDSVLQAEVINRKDQLKVRGTVKAAVLEGDPGCPNLVASSVYDTKPVHYLSMITSELKWIVKEKIVYNVDSGKSEILSFLRMNNIHTYNSTMGNVDIADQLRGSYRLDYWARNRKWWWSLVFWMLGVFLTNAYVVYGRICDEHGVPKQHRLTHLEFRKEIALAWINPELQAQEWAAKRGTGAIGANSDNRK